MLRHCVAETDECRATAEGIHERRCRPGSGEASCWRPRGSRFDPFNFYVTKLPNHFRILNRGEKEMWSGSSLYGSLFLPL
jgi:hypothetical protein